MNRLNRYALSLLALSVMIAIIAGVNATPTQASGSAPVTVVNTPLPVTGNVTAAQSGPWNVNIDNTPGVNIANMPAVSLAPGASIRDADNPARQPFQIALLVQLDPGVAVADNLFPVPDGKRLVIEYVSGFGEIPIGQSLTNVSVSTSVRGDTPPNQSPPVVSHFFVPTVTGSYNGTVNNNVISAQTRFYSDGCNGCYVQVQANRNGTNGSADFHFSIAGYLVDIP